MVVDVVARDVVVVDASVVDDVDELVLLLVVVDEVLLVEDVDAATLVVVTGGKLVVDDDVLVEVVVEVVRLVLVELLVDVLVVLDVLVLDVVVVVIVLVVGTGSVVVVETALEKPTIWKITLAGTPSEVVTKRSLLSRSTSSPSGPASKVTSLTSPKPCAKRTSTGFRVPSCGRHVVAQLGSTNAMPVAGSIATMRSSPSVYDTYMRSPWNGAGRN